MIGRINAAGHISPLMKPDSLQTLVNNAVETLTPHAQNFDAIAFRGMSGALVSAPIAIALKKHLILVRKNEVRYSCHGVEGPKGDYNYLIVDDLISSGDTVRAIHREIGYFEPNAKLFGFYTHYYNKLEDSAFIQRVISRDDSGPCTEKIYKLKDKSFAIGACGRLCQEDIRFIYNGDNQSITTQSYVSQNVDDYLSSICY
jgi:hypothetical protein